MAEKPLAREESLNRNNHHPDLKRFIEFVEEEASIMNFAVSQMPPAVKESALKINSNNEKPVKRTYLTESEKDKSLLSSKQSLNR